MFNIIKHLTQRGGLITTLKLCAHLRERFPSYNVGVIIMKSNPVVGDLHDRFPSTIFYKVHHKRSLTHRCTTVSILLFTDRARAFKGILLRNVTDNLTAIDCQCTTSTSIILSNVGNLRTRGKSRRKFCSTVHHLLRSKRVVQELKGRTHEAIGSEA